MNRDEIGFAIDIVHALGKFRADCFRTVFSQIRIVSHDAHSKSNRALGDFRSDASHSQNAQSFSSKFNALK